MSFELDYWTLRKPAFQSGMRKLLTHTGYSNTKTSYNIARMGTLIEQEIKVANKLVRDLTEEFVEMEVTPRGTLPKRLNGQYVMKDEERRPEFQERFEDLHNHVVTIERYKVKLGEIENVKGLSPNELLALEPLIEE